MKERAESRKGTGPRNKPGKVGDSVCIKKLGRISRVKKDVARVQVAQGLAEYASKEEWKATTRKKDTKQTTQGNTDNE